MSAVKILRNEKQDNDDGEILHSQVSPNDDAGACCMLCNVRKTQYKRTDMKIIYNKDEQYIIIL